MSPAKRHAGENGWTYRRDIMDVVMVRRICAASTRPLAHFCQSLYFNNYLNVSQVQQSPLATLLKVKHVLIPPSLLLYGPPVRSALQLTSGCGAGAVSSEPGRWLSTDGRRAERDLNEPKLLVISSNAHRNRVNFSLDAAHLFNHDSF